MYSLIVSLKLLGFTNNVYRCFRIGKNHIYRHNIIPMISTRLLVHIDIMICILVSNLQLQLRDIHKYLDNPIQVEKDIS